MIDHAISSSMLTLLLLAMIGTAVTLGLLLDRLGVMTWKWLPEAIKYVADHAKSPDAGDRLVGMTIVICGVMFLISDYANDWYGVAL